MGLNLNKYIRKNQLAELLGVHLSTLNRLIKADSTFPAKIKIGARAVAFDMDDVNEWLESRKQ